jgi:hypothetical protein
MTNPDGNVDGLLLADNTIVRVPPHIGKLLADSINPSDPVKVQGNTESAGAIRAIVVTDLRTQRSIADTPPEPGNPPPMPNPESRRALSAQGQIKLLTHASLGDIDGAILSDGTIVHFPPFIGEQWARILRVNETLAVTGFGTANAYGRSLEVTSIGPTVDQMQAVGPDSRSPNRPMRGNPGKPPIGH